MEGPGPVFQDTDQTKAQNNGNQTVGHESVFNVVPPGAHDLQGVPDEVQDDHPFGFRYSLSVGPGEISPHDRQIQKSIGTFLSMV
jgi:hypothetical protein